jgi:hypothetical protein
MAGDCPRQDSTTAVADEGNRIGFAFRTASDLRQNLLLQPPQASRIYPQRRGDRGISNVAQPVPQRFKVKIVTEESWHYDHESAVAARHIASAENRIGEESCQIGGS